jgi:hypothetical protein
VKARETERERGKKKSGAKHTHEKTMPEQPKQKTASSSSLYGTHQKRSQGSSSIGSASASNLAFTNTLNNLIQNTYSSNSASEITPTTGRSSRDKKGKDDIFTTHNRNAAKRAAADDEDDYRRQQQQHHMRSADIGGDVDEGTLSRSKRKLEEKVRIYEELKKGAYLLDGGSDSEEDISGHRRRGDGDGSITEGEKYLSRLRRKEREGLVDFDRKWAEKETGQTLSDGDEDDEEGGGPNDVTGNNQEDVLIEYEDEFGRTRRGTRAEAARAVAAKMQNSDGDNNEAARSRPSRPSNLIYGEVIQAEAFQPDELAASQMSYLALRRDRSPTPPEATHYDADAEVRNRGTGFYAFSKDEAIREKEMEELRNARNQTEQIRKIRSERRKEREKVRDERRRQIKDLRARHHADRFLEGLGSGLGVEGLS